MSRKRRKVKAWYGPQQPRIKRIRGRSIAMPRPQMDYYATVYPSTDWIHTGQSLGPLHFDTSVVIDTIRNPNFQGSRADLPDDGGELTVSRNYWELVNHPVDSGNHGHSRAVGQVWLNFYSEFQDGISTSGDSPPAADLDLSSYGPGTWRRFKPAKPDLQLGVFIAELRDLPALLHASLRSLKDIADYFLAIKFGWQPLLSDIRKMVNTYLRASVQIDFLLANAGKPVRRSGKVDSITDSIVFWDEAGTRMENVEPAYYVDSPNLSQAFRQSSRRELQRDIWYAAEYLFYFDDLQFPDKRAHIWAGLWGLRITPADVWDALPWSWLIDWFSTTGDILHNLLDNVADRQVSPYAYIMGHTNRKYTQWTTNGYGSCSATHVFDTKIRRKVDPFGLAPGVGLSNTQLAVLAALGIQRI